MYTMMIDNDDVRLPMWQCSP